MPRAFTLAPTPSVAMPTLVSGAWYATGARGTLSTNSMGNNGERVLPLFLPGGTIQALAIDVTAAGEASSTFIVTLRAHDYSTGLPGRLIWSSASMSTASISTPSLTGLSLSIPGHGLYWMGGVTQNAATTAPTMRSVGIAGVDIPVPMSTTASTPAAATAAGIGMILNNVTGTPPTTGTGWNNAGIVPRILYRMA